MAHPFAVQDKFTQKTQDLSLECKEGSCPIMLLGVLLGSKVVRCVDYSSMEYGLLTKILIGYMHALFLLARDRGKDSISMI